MGLRRLRPLLEARGRAATVLAVEAKPGMVGAALADDFGAALYLESMPVQTVALPDLLPVANGATPEGENAEAATGDDGGQTAGDETADDGATGPSNLQDWLTIVQLRNQPWTVTFHALFKPPSHAFPMLSLQAQEISESLGCRALLAQYDGAKNEVAYRFFVEGRVEELAHYRPGAELLLFESKTRLPPAREEFAASKDDLLDSLCEQLELEIPACYPGRFADAPMLFAVDPTAVSYERVDLLIVPLDDETCVIVEDEETVIFQPPGHEAPPVLAPPAAAAEPAGVWNVFRMLEKLLGGKK
jgi:hypothetical protein